MSFEDERRAIESRFASNFTTVTADRIAWENRRFKQPDTGTWVRFTVLNGETRNAALSNTILKRTIGVIAVQVFVPELTGTKTAREAADAVATVFQNQQFSAGNSGTITCRAASIRSIGIDAGWFQINVTCPYQRDQTT